jgi:hypothetical protein
MRIAHEIGWEPANRERFKLPIHVRSRRQTWCQFGLLVIRKHSDDRNKRVRMFRVIPAVLVSERNNEIAIAQIVAFTKAS